MDKNDGANLQQVVRFHLGWEIVQIPSVEFEARARFLAVPRELVMAKHRAPSGKLEAAALGSRLSSKSEGIIIQTLSGQSPPVPRLPPCELATCRF